MTPNSQLRCWHCNSLVHIEPLPEPHPGGAGWLCPRCGQHGGAFEEWADDAEDGCKKNCPYLLTILETPELKKHLAALWDKYWNLVWYARSDPQCYPNREDSLRATVFMAQSQIEGAYPKETGDLNSPDISDWTHGFNSGMLAALNLVTSAIDFGMDIALEEFPMLDT
jgi:hypothetical protein